MKVVLDTNVFISGIFFTGPPFRILSAWRDGDVKIVISAEILDEYRRVGIALAEQFPDINIRPILELVAGEAETVRALKFHSRSGKCILKTNRKIRGLIRWHGHIF